MYKVIDMDQFAFFYKQTDRPVPFVENIFFFPLYGFGFFTKNQMSIGGGLFLSRQFYSIDSVSFFFSS